jgi:hypothetical protein
MRIHYAVDQEYTIEMVVTNLNSHMSKEAIEAKRLTMTEPIIHLMNSDLLKKNKQLYDGIQIIVPAENKNVILSHNEIFTWLKEKNEIFGCLTLTKEECDLIEKVLHGFYPYYWYINKFRQERGEEPLPD